MTHRTARPAVFALLALAAACPAQTDLAAPAAPPPAPAPVNADPAAAKILQDAADAAKALVGISYTTTFTSDLMGIKQLGKAEVLMLRDFEHEGRWLKRWIGTHEVVSMEPTRVEVADQGDTITYIDHAKREYHEQPARYVNPRGIEPLVYLWVPEIAEGDKLNKMPYAKYLEAPGGVTFGVPENVGGKEYPSPEVGPVDDVGGVACDVVTADFGENLAKRTLWIGQEDHLPRRLQWAFKDAGTWKWELSDVKVNAALVPALFELPLPDGYKRFDPPPPVTPGATGSSSTVMGPGGGLTTDSNKGRAVSGLAVGNLAPDFTLPMITLDSSGPGLVPVKGKSFTLSAERSHVIILDFFGSWNAQSKTAAPELAKMAAAIRGQPVKIISLAVRERDEAKPLEFLSMTPYAAALLPDADEVVKLYKARVIPTYFAVGFEGEIIYTSSTYARDATVKEMQAAVTNYLQSHSPGGREAAPAAGGDAGDESSK